jgi:DNA-binding transcriptional regulator GbsR (MarR family)
MHKEVHMLIHDENVAVMLKSALVATVKRNQDRRVEVLDKLEVALNEENRAEVAQELKKLIYTDLQLKEELGLLIPLVQVLGDDSVSTDTEVLKYLPDLEKDGLGVDSGGEETVGISSDHLDE